MTISKDDTIILDGAGDKADIEERCELLRDTIADTTSEYEKEKLQVLAADHHRIATYGCRLTLVPPGVAPFVST